MTYGKAPRHPAGPMLRRNLPPPQRALFYKRDVRQAYMALCGGLKAISGPCLLLLVNVHQYLVEIVFKLTERIIELRLKLGEGKEFFCELKCHHRKHFL